MSFYYNEIQKIADNTYINKESLVGKKFLVTGANGLIGRYFTDILVSCGAAVSVLVRDAKKAEKIFGDSVNIFEYDVSKVDIAKLPNFDYIIHAASPANPKAFIDDPIGTINANIMGTRNILELSRRCGASIVFTSSSEVYGENIYNRALSENDYGIVDCTNPRACYTESKRMSENMCVAYQKQFGVEILIARIAFCYGGNFTDSDNRVVPQFIRMALEDKNILMQSSGTMVRSYIYVADVVESILYLLTNNFYGVYNIANPDSTVSIRDLAETICELTDARFEINAEYLDNKKGVSPFTNGILDSSKLIKVLPQKMRFNIKDGLRSSINIFKEKV